VLPTLQESVDRAIALAEKLGDQGVLGALKAIKAELSTPILLNIDIDSDAITKRLNERLTELRKAVNNETMSEKEGRALVAKEKFGAGFASALSESIAQGAAAAFQGKNPLQAIGQALSSSFGSLLVDAGVQALKASAIMQSLYTAISTMNPWAAAAAAAALIVFGSAIGGRGGASGASGGGFASTSPASPISITRMIVDPSAGVRQRIASSGQQSAMGPQELESIPVIGIATPRGVELIGTANGQFMRKRST
jgi:hypothetical protein